MFEKHPEYFLTIAREGSISRAAELLYLSQPYLSQYLARLEKQLGCVLLDRRHNPLKPTGAGELFLAYLEQQRYLSRQLDSDLQRLRTDQRQVVRIGMAVWRGASLLPDVMPEFIRRWPEAQVVIHEAPAPQLEQLLDQGDADLCLLQSPISGDKIVYETLLRERILLVGRRDHPLLAGWDSTLQNPKPIDLRRLENQRFILLPPDWRLGQLVRNAFHAMNLQPQDTILTTNNTTAVNLVAEGLGFAFVPETGARRCYRLEDLSFYTVGDPPLSSTLLTAYKKDSFLSPAARAFIQLVREIYGAPGQD